MPKERRISFEDEKMKELERKVDELAAENRELLTFVDESVRIAEEFKQKAFLMGESLEKDAQLIYARALYDHSARDHQELSLSKDEIIIIEGNIDDDGFYSAKNFKKQSGLSHLLSNLCIKYIGDGRLRLSGKLQRNSFILISQKESFSLLSGPSISTVLQNSAELIRVLELQSNDETVLKVSKPISLTEREPLLIKIVPSTTSARVILPEMENDFHLHLRASNFQQIVTLQKGTKEHVFKDLSEETSYTIVFEGYSYVFTTVKRETLSSYSSGETDEIFPQLKNLRGSLEGNFLTIEWDEYENAKEYKLYTRDGTELVGTVKEGNATSLELNYDVNTEAQQALYMDVTNIKGFSSLKTKIPITMIVRALFDYIPETMSPNSDYTRELAFSENEVLSVRLPVDKDGFYFGEKLENTMRGLVPSNFVQPI